MKDPAKPQTQTSGAKPPPRPPSRTAIACGPDDSDGDDSIRRRKQETVRINLPPKPFPTIKLPTLPLGTPIGPGIKLPTPPVVSPTLSAPTHNATANVALHAGNFLSAALVLGLQAVLLFEARVSIDHATAILFMAVALGLSVPGYMWAFEKVPSGSKQKGAQVKEA